MTLTDKLYIATKRILLFGVLSVLCIPAFLSIGTLWTLSLMLFRSILACQKSGIILALYMTIVTKYRMLLKRILELLNLTPITIIFKNGLHCFALGKQILLLLRCIKNHILCLPYLIIIIIMVLFLLHFWNQPFPIVRQFLKK